MDIFPVCAEMNVRAVEQGDIANREVDHVGCRHKQRPAHVPEVVAKRKRRSIVPDLCIVKMEIYITLCVKRQQ